MSNLKVINGNMPLVFERFKQIVLWHEGYQCDCLISGRPDPNCSCYNGWKYKSPIATNMLRSNHKHVLQQTMQGKIQKYDAAFTIAKIVNNIEQPAYDRITYMDVIEVNRGMVYEEILVKDVNDTLSSFTVLEILHVMHDGTQLVLGTDYTYNTATKTFTLLDTDNAPDAQDQYSVKYRAKMQYLVHSEVTDRGIGSEVDLTKLVRCVYRRFERADAISAIDNLEF